MLFIEVLSMSVIYFIDTLMLVVVLHIDSANQQGSIIVQKNDLMVSCISFISLREITILDHVEINILHSYTNII